MNRSAIPWVAAAVVFAVHLAGNPHYGFFRDELYFIICGFHPQFGYVDQPPLVPLLSALTQLGGHSLFLLRAVPAVFAAAGVYTTCLLVTEYGGGAFAQILASLVFLFTGVLMSFGMKVSTDTVGLWTWPLLALLVVRLSKGADQRLWLLAGLIAGITIESKYSVVFFLAALILGLMLTPHRRLLRTSWFAAGLAVMILIALPNFLWQWHYGFPMFQLLQAGQSGKNISVGPILYVAQEIIITGLFLAVVWIVGLVWLFRSTSFRFLAYAYVVLIAEMMLFHGKHYYPADVYPILIASGAVAIEAWTRVRGVTRAAITAAVIVVGVFSLPTSLPVLPESAYVAYASRLSRALHIPNSATQTEHGRDEGNLPGDWADMHGWPELAASVEAVYKSLSPAERSQAVVFAGNYGEASAVAFFTPNIPVISEHNQYWLWGPRGNRGNVLVQIGGTCFRSDRLFASRTFAATAKSRWAMAYENNLPIWICRGIKKPLADVWPSIKSYE